MSNFSGIPKAPIIGIDCLLELSSSIVFASLFLSDSASNELLPNFQLSANHDICSLSKFFSDEIPRTGICRVVQLIKKAFPGQSFKFPRNLS